MIKKIAKPEGTTWTDHQWDAIAINGHDMLVAAAAGSGKTAVLVERIIRRISDEQQPVDVDRLLVATFTNAAAAEMRHRISEALEKALERNPDSDHLRRQLALIGRASITTLHSFCLEVIQTHYQRIGLDPGFRIANETESELMRQDLIEELFEEQYGEASEDSDFWRLVEWFGGEKSDDALYRLVQRLYDDSRSHPQPAAWLRQTAAMFDRQPQSDNPWLPSLVASVQLELQAIAAALKEAVAIAELPSGPEPYLYNLREDLAAVADLQEAARHSWGRLYDAFRGVSFGKLKACKGDQYDKALQEQVKELRNSAKDQLNAVAEELFARSPEQYDEELRVLAPLMQSLVELVIEFGRRYQEAKKSKGIVDFSDLEHFCLQILSEQDEQTGDIRRSPVAVQYREHYVEVLLDEYQDTNRVQEAIVALIAREAPGNRFMVGDVKQSIYRFRLAEPGLFMEKYRSYLSEGSIPGQRIDLAQNFRSRTSVVDGVNYIFHQLMGETVAEIEYDERAKLAYGAKCYPAWDATANGTDSVELLLIDRTDADPARDGKQVLEYSESGTDSEDTGQPGGSDPVNEAIELETAQLEARMIAAQIGKLLGRDGGPVFQVYDKTSGGQRDITYRDMVILLRATQQWSPVLIEELRAQGIPAYAELSTGYFSATEVEVLLSLLQIIDNPFQDIPLASVLRSPIVQLSTEELAQIRIAGGHGTFYDAVCAYARAAETDAAHFAEESRSSRAQGAEAASEPSRPDGTQTVEDVSEELRSSGTQGLAAFTQDAWRTSHHASGLLLPAWLERTDDSKASGTASDSGNSADLMLSNKLQRFLRQLHAWRQEAQQGALADLIWNIYRVTGFYDFVGGLPGGQQRQANLRALYDRARQYEATSFRGLFRFLRFVERMKDSGGDLGTARALGEQEDVVRIMSIHKSKGLEFPVVFAAGLAKRFNQRDLTETFMVHKDLGFGPKFIDMEARISYPTLPWLVIRRKARMEMLAEEMRVLYVALTRAREKLYLLATVKEVDKLLHSWSRYLEHEARLLPDEALAKARSYIDWIGPALLRHPDAEMLRELAGAPRRVPDVLSGEKSRWEVRLARPEVFAGMAQVAAASEIDTEQQNAVFSLAPVDNGRYWETQTWNKLSWRYPGAQASTLLSKTSVTELKRLSEHHKLLEQLSDAPHPTDGTGSEFRPAIARRPRFMEQSKLNAAERGTVFHSVMQHMQMNRAPSAENVRETLADMVHRELLTQAQSEVVDPDVIVTFFQTDLGRRLLRSPQVYREMPFSYGLPAHEVYNDTDPMTSDETILLQGVIDCIFEEEQGMVLLDYKTDHLRGGGAAALAAIREKYRLQLDLYARAVEHIWKRPIVGKYLFLFDGAHVLEL
ncbi:helicase-exonuclease AddAB subunit AddA [Paenibacillus xerothermodurans]|uniref:ATP-dependent helicase/nuclease subunit A n=1 Tax=Paenibacillus xerothermodurans TaxID=1977292 RepID=A0A2W1NG96_PAEXE|nr:helicase-exonuclease AddAB subunit AddA [Paenibacillus xerothermodurans]PZE22710.1 helicase-exonuclease AddAB subunit AddA [Paenibacillus xerothermodurans]